MQRYFAFLRAINVGGHLVKMAVLRGLFEDLDFANVETFIASGNVIFESDERDAHALERRIEEHLRAALGYDVATFLRTRPELATLVAHPAFPDVDVDDTHTLHVALLAGRPKVAAGKALLAFRTDDDHFHVNGREAYWLRRGRMSDSKFSGATLEKTLGVAATMRNANTLNRLLARYPEA